MKLTYLSLGSNLGDRQINIQSALNQIDKRAGNIISISKLYENPSFGFEGDMFYNCCIGLKTILSPVELLNQILHIEIEGGRIRKIEEGYLSRTIDIDILFYENQTINSDELKVPHPKLHERNFVIKPLLDIQRGKFIRFLKNQFLRLEMS